MRTLAINGGTPLLNEFIGYGKQYIDQADIDGVVAALKSDFLTTGPLVTQFEEAICKITKSRYCVAVSNGTAALHAAVFALGVGPGDEVITTGFSFAATANCILYQGAKVVFVDIDQETLNIDPDEIEKHITPLTKAIIVVHYAGIPADMERINEMAKKYNISVIEDASHAIGTEINDQPVGSISDLTTFSFHPVKTVTTCEGGAITTNCKELYTSLLQFRTHGITRDPMYLNDLVHENWYYEQQLLGYNYRLSDVHAALGISQLEKLDVFMQKRNELVAVYDEHFTKHALVSSQKNPGLGLVSRHLYVILLKLDKLKANRDQVFKALAAENIGVNVHYIPIYHHPFYQDLGYAKDMNPITNKVFESIITLPLHYGISFDNQTLIIQAVNEVLDFYKR